MDQAYRAEDDQISPEENRSILENSAVPLERKILNLDASRFEKSEYVDGRYRLKDLNILRELAPGIYEDAAGQVKEYNEALFESKGQFRKYNLGRKLGSIPVVDMALHPELGFDRVAQDKYFIEHPELKTRE